MTKYLTLFLLLFSVACNPYVNTTLNESRIKHEPYKDLVFALVENDTIEISDSCLIGNITINDDGFRINCNYPTLISLATERARLMGGNCLQIKEHNISFFKIDCHEIKAKVYRIDDPRKHEKFISWNENRKLELLDFKGDGKQKVKTQYGIVCYLKARRRDFDYGEMFKVGIESFFLCKDAHLESVHKDSFHLVNENICFDITELYRRKLNRKIREELFSYNQLYGQIERVLGGIMKECKAKQKQCRMEITKDNTKQKDWLNWVETELVKLESYSFKSIELPLKSY